LNDEQIGRIRAYICLLERWNRSISLVSTADMSFLLERHIGESLFALSVVSIEHGRLADVGSGAGFPGIPIKIVRPDVDLLLFESNQRKSAFLAEVIRVLRLSPASVIQSRYELDARPLQLDFLTSRALGSYSALLKWGRSQLSATGNIVLWLGRDDAASISSESHWNWRDRILIPTSKQRVLLIGEPRF
jgi:16S rRNA (guanine527-N7)-methyltransferase